MVSMMTIVDKYLAREILKGLVVVLAVVVGLYVIVEFFNKADNFIEAGLPISRLIRYLQLKLPQIIAQITPVGLLLAVLITFGLMNKNNEIIALKSGGISVYYLLRPILTIAIFLAILLFSLSEIVVPITISRANIIWLMEVKNKPTLTSKQRNIWVKGRRAIYFIQYFNSQNQTISGVILNFFDNEFKLTRRVDAKTGVYVQGKWIFYDSMEQVLDAESASYNVRFHLQKAENVDFLPEDLMRVFKRSDEMNIAELFTYIREVESEGYDATTFRVDFHARFAYPVICLIVCLMATGIAVKRKSREGPSVNIGFGAALVFLYWVLHSFCLSLGYGGLLPPIISAWISNIIFSCYGVLNLINAE
jgi:lipopolysaccharide export system permease protein